MDYVRFGKTGMQVSRLCLGCMTYGLPESRAWALVESESQPYLKAALDAGINFFDTADVYSAGESERIVGNFLKGAVPRDEVVLATKVFNAMGPKPNQKGLSRKHIMEGIDASLKRLKTDYVDLYIIHRLDPNTEMEEIIEALHDVVKAGKALYLGASSMWAWQFAKLVTMQKERGLAHFVSMQSYYNLIYREDEREMNAFCQAEGIALTPWSPMARGFLAGNMPQTGTGTKRAQTDHVMKTLGIGDEQDYAILDRVQTVANRLGVSLAQVATAWVLAQPGITSPIIGTSKPHHLPEALKALELKLDEATLAELAEPYHAKNPRGGFA